MKSEELAGDMGRRAPRRRSAQKRPPTRVPEAAPPEPAHTGDPAEPSEAATSTVVGIGASAGGLEAFSQLLKALPVDTGMAFVLVQHLDPTHASQLPEILSRATTMPVLTVTDGRRAEPDHVYVIPPNADMTISGGVFKLTPRSTAARHTPIDQFFRSLAQEEEGRAIGVVLSGTGSDGTLGLRAIKAEGGITFVQDTKSAKHPDMPRSAAADADFVLPPARIADELARIGGHPYVHRAAPSSVDAGRLDEGADVNAVLRVLRTATGVDFAQYKPASVRRRIARRMLLAKIEDLGAYARHVRQTPREALALRDDLLIQVTGFFRDPEGFEALKRKVFPVLVKGRAANDPIRIWVPGCATGEEAYSLAICLLEFLEERDTTFPIQMFATDLSGAAVARARAGTFPASIEAEVSPERLRRFFVQTDGRYQVTKAIREVCVFAPQDVTRDPPFSKLDLISCCNVLIYLGAALQERVLSAFHYALKPNGFLKLGPSEGVGRLTSLFSAVAKEQKIYARKPGPSGHVGFTAGRPIPAQAGVEETRASSSAAMIEREADRLILGRFAPAGVVVNSDMDIVHIRGKTGPYLEATPGEASLDLFKMARAGLGSVLRRALHQASKRGSPVKTTGVRVKANGQTREVSLEVIPLGSTEGRGGHGRPHYLILFLEGRPRGVASARGRGRAVRRRRAEEPRVAQLVRELAAGRRQLDTISEEHEAAMEELRAATEETQSSNEELQSTNEELETAKEELQATNEELHTVNDELSSRNLELGRLSDDLGNLLTSTQVPIIMVGSDLRVRRMTPVSERVLGMSPEDIGRPIGDLRLGLEIRDLEALLREVIENLTVLEREVLGRDGRWYALRVRPYRTADNRIDGAVISLLDIDAMKRGLEQTQEARDQAQAIIATVREPLVVLDADLRVVTANPSFYETFQVTPDRTEGQSIFELGNRQWDIPRLRTLLEEILPRDSAVEHFEVEHQFESIGRRTMVLNARRVLSATGQPALILLAMEDVTERKGLEAAQAALLEREHAVRKEAEAATAARDKFVAVMSHELRTPLQAMLAWARILRTQNLDQAATARALEVIERNTVLQTRLIEDLLDASRIIAGTLQLESRPVLVAPAVEAALTAMRPVAEAKGVRLESQMEGSARPVRGDPARLQQVIWNLVANAIKFTPRGGRIDVRLVRRESAIEISVRDTGEGIAPKDLPHIFNRFGVAHTSTQSHGGLGLGLAIVKHLVELHGGTVRAASAGIGQGATFTVSLPVTGEGPADETGDHDVAARRLAPARLPALQGIRVLVVEDEADAREVIRTILSQCGAEVTAAATARAALTALQEAPFDVLVSDIAMPEDDGYALMRKIRALEAGRGGQIPALALTAYAMSEDRAKAVSAGYDRHAAKPIDPFELAGAVALLAGRGEPARE